MPDILHLIRVAAPPRLVYRALTTVDGVRRWWTRDAELEERRDGIGTFRFYGGTSETKVRIDALDPEQRVGWTVLSANAPGGWVGTRIGFDLRAEKDGTVLRFAHRGFREENDGVALVTTGWAYYLTSLRHYVETGKGAPHPDLDFGCMLR